ncbi:hypothetical protein CRG98_023428 [Punica granatum]|nr:hypothetical protein CRG98_023428 [Punica granatum]
MAAVMAQVSTMVVNKVALTGGTNKFVLVFYSYCLSSLLFLPSLLLLRRPSCAPLTSPVLLKFFLLSFIMLLSQMFGLVGIDYSSPTLGTSLMNLIPAFTFILALIFRMEKLDWMSSSSLAKVVGTVVSIGGAFIVTFYNGPPLSIVNVVPKYLLILLSPHSRWIVGGFFLAGEALTTSLIYIVKAMVLRDYPVVLIMMFFTNLFVAVTSALLALVAVKEPESWTPKLGSGWVAVVYSTVVGSVFRFTVIAWCIQKRGPLYVAMFKPLGIVFAMVLGVIFLGDPLCLGSLIGAIVIVGGFYVVMWGKAKEEKAVEPIDQSGFLPSSSNKIPLLAARSDV